MLFGQVRLVGCLGSAIFRERLGQKCITVADFVEFRSEDGNVVRVHKIKLCIFGYELHSVELDKTDVE